jgi:hypothetical protein
MSKYHNPDLCPLCNSVTRHARIVMDSWVICECDVSCTKCEFQSYWGHGFYQYPMGELAIPEKDRI